MTIPVSPFSSFMASAGPMAARSSGGSLSQGPFSPGNFGARNDGQNGSGAFGGDNQSMMQMLTLMMGMMGMMMLMMMGLFSRLLEGASPSPAEIGSPGGETPSGTQPASGNQPPAQNQPAGQPGGQPPAGAQQPNSAQPPSGPASEQTVTNIGGNNPDDPNLNLERRGYTRVSGPSGLTNVGGPTDPKAPQLASLFRAQDGLPQFSSMYQIGAMDPNNPGGPLAGIATRPGQEILLPRSGYQIDGQGHQARVLYNDGDWLVLNYTADNSIAKGYTVHIKGLHSNLQPGTNVSAADVLGTAQGQEILFSIRDTGSFMDPRIQKDWWQNNAQPA